MTLEVVLLAMWTRAPFSRTCVKAEEEKLVRPTGFSKVAPGPGQNCVLASVWGAHLS